MVIRHFATTVILCSRREFLDYKGKLGPAHCTPLKKGVLNERVAQARAAATRLQPPKSASLRDAGFASPSGGAGMWLLLCPRACGFVRTFD